MKALKAKQKVIKRCIVRFCGETFMLSQKIFTSQWSTMTLCGGFQLSPKGFSEATKKVIFNFSFVFQFFSFHLARTKAEKCTSNVPPSSSLHIKLSLLSTSRPTKSHPDHLASSFPFRFAFTTRKTIFHCICLPRRPSPNDPHRLSYFEWTFEKLLLALKWHEARLAFSRRSFALPASPLRLFLWIFRHTIHHSPAVCFFGHFWMSWVDFAVPISHSKLSDVSIKFRRVPSAGKFDGNSKLFVKFKPKD